MAARESELQSQDDKNAEDEEKHSRRNSEAENLLNCGAVDIAVVGRKDTPKSFSDWLSWNSIMIQEAFV
ncbi:uncharacterized protein LOC111054219 isoform X2 [Nilaparvata lugens]|uniref:uncharacterized protein LOC111054219 isoform X2 n=1 Tax=Nilaparvata lugens TaxID=108931 RepID=UPI00193D669A|nr:uncharacterized protein LOC111054219 isoform X2 [Nilaparvata lugens]